MDDLKKYALEALDFYGRNAQDHKALEEVDELSDALFCWLTFGVNADEVIDEIADVLIMVTQMRIAFGVDAVDERIAFKIQRQRERMKGAK